MILLKEGTDSSQGIPQIVSNINACGAIADAVRTTLGPRGMDKLIVDDKGQLLSNKRNYCCPVLNIAILVCFFKSHMVQLACLEFNIKTYNSHTHLQCLTSTYL